MTISSIKYFITLKTFYWEATACIHCVYLFNIRGGDSVLTRSCNYFIYRICTQL